MKPTETLEATHVFPTAGLLMLVVACSAQPAPPTLDIALPAPSAPPSVSAPKPITQPAVPIAPNLTLDPTFGGSGRALFSRAPGEHELKGLAALADGRILVAGHAQFADGMDACVARYTEGGLLDPTFGEAGIARIHRVGAFGEEIALDSEGRVLFAAYAYTAGGAAALLLSRFSADGVLDRSFAHGGTATEDFGKSDARPVEILPLRGGGALVAGIHSLPKNDYELYIARFDAAGQLDKGFGTGGAAFFDPIPGREFVTDARAMTDGSIVLGGYMVGKDGGFITKVKPDGAPDRDFGVNGVTVVRDPAMSAAWALAIDDHDHVFLGGQLVSQGDHGGAAVYRFTSRGLLDFDWGRDGVAYGPTDSSDQLYALLVGEDGSVLGVGFRGLADHARALLVRFRADGELDPAFGSPDHSAKGGVLLGRAFGEFPVAAAVDPKGRVVIAGFADLARPDAMASNIVGVVERFAPPNR